MKITKSYLKQIILEELTRLDEASGIENYFTSKNMNTYDVSDKNKANSIASLVSTIKDLLKQPNVSREDIVKHYTDKITSDQKNAASKNKEPGDKEAISIITQIPVTTGRSTSN